MIDKVMMNRTSSVDHLLDDLAALSDPNTVISALKNPSTLARIPTCMWDRYLESDYLPVATASVIGGDDDSDEGEEQVKDKVLEEGEFVDPDLPVSEALQSVASAACSQQKVPMPQIMRQHATQETFVKIQAKPQKLRMERSQAPSTCRNSPESVTFFSNIISGFQTRVTKHDGVNHGAAFGRAVSCEAIVEKLKPMLGKEALEKVSDQQKPSFCSKEQSQITATGELEVAVTGNSQQVGFGERVENAAINSLPRQLDPGVSGTPPITLPVLEEALRLTQSQTAGERSDPSPSVNYHAQTSSKKPLTFAPYPWENLKSHLYARQLAITSPERVAPKRAKISRRSTSNEWGSGSSEDVDEDGAWSILFPRDGSGKDNTSEDGVSAVNDEKCVKDSHVTNVVQNRAKIQDDDAEEHPKQLEPSRLADSDDQSAAENGNADEFTCNLTRLEESPVTELKSKLSPQNPNIHAEPRVETTVMDESGICIVLPDYDADRGKLLNANSAGDSDRCLPGEITRVVTRNSEEGLDGVVPDANTQRDDILGERSVAHTGKVPSDAQVSPVSEQAISNIAHENQVDGQYVNLEPQRAISESQATSSRPPCEVTEAKEQPSAFANEHSSMFLGSKDTDCVSHPSPPPQPRAPTPRTPEKRSPQQIQQRSGIPVSDPLSSPPSVVAEVGPPMLDTHSPASSAPFEESSLNDSDVGPKEVEDRTIIIISEGFCAPDTDTAMYVIASSGKDVVCKRESNAPAPPSTPKRRVNHTLTSRKRRRRRTRTACIPLHSGVIPIGFEKMVTRMNLLERGGERPLKRHASKQVIQSTTALKKVAAISEKQPVLIDLTNSSDDEPQGPASNDFARPMDLDLGPILIRKFSPAQIALRETLAFAPFAKTPRLPRKPFKSTLDRRLEAINVVFHQRRKMVKKLQHMEWFEKGGVKKARELGKELVILKGHWIKNKRTIKY